MVSAPVTSHGVVEAGPAGRTGRATVANFAGRDSSTASFVLALGTGGAITFTNTSSMYIDLLVDVTGFYSNSVGEQFVGIVPLRVVDTRSGLGIAPGIGKTGFFALPVAGRYSIPAAATAVAISVTVSDPKHLGGAFAGPAVKSGRGQSAAVMASLVGGRSVTNAGQIRLGNGGALILSSWGTGGDVIVDITGYFLPVGPQPKVTVPSLVGASTTEAEKRCEKARLDCDFVVTGTVALSDFDQAGKVTRQSPAAGAQLPSHANVVEVFYLDIPH